MDLNLNHLRSFYIAAVEGSVSGALDRLMVTQPVFAGHLKSLERAVGVRLMVREGNSVHLTATGESVFRKASKVFKEVREAELLLEDISSRKGAELKIGCPEVLEGRLPPQLIADFEKARPGVRVVVTGGKEAALAKSVEDGRNDLALFRFKPFNCRLKTRAIGEEELVLIASPSSIHVTGNEVSVDDLGDVPLVAMKEGFAVRETVIEYLQKFDVRPRIAFECSSAALLKELVRRDNAVGFMERSAVESDVEQCFLKEVRITEGSPRVIIAIGYPHRREISPAARTFLRLVGRTGINPAGRVRLSRKRRVPQKDPGEPPPQRQRTGTRRFRSHGLK